MKSNDFPGNPNSKVIAGLRTPEEIPAPQGSRAAARAAMLANVSAEADGASLTVAPPASVTPSAELIIGERMGERVLADIPVDQVVRSPFQPRLVFDEKKLEELATSIQTIGLGKPIIVRRLPSGKYELVGGERRWRSVKIIGHATIPAVIQDMTDGIAMILALTDNGGEDLSDYEYALSYHRILEAKEESSLRGLARRLGIDVSIVSRCLSLMRLPEGVRKILDSNPSLITSNYAKRFLEHAETHPVIVEKAVETMAQTGGQQEAALRSIEKEIAALNKTPLPAKSNSLKVNGVGTIKISGTKLELKCDKGIDVQSLGAKFEAFLKSLDLGEVKVKTP